MQRSFIGCTERALTALKRPARSPKCACSCARKAAGGAAHNASARPGRAVHTSA